MALNVVPDPHVRSQVAFNQKLIEGENLLKSKLLVLKRHYIHHLTLHCIASCVNVSSMHSLSRSPSVQSSGSEVRAEQASKLQCLHNYAELCCLHDSGTIPHELLKLFFEPPLYPKTPPTRMWGIFGAES